MGPFAQWSYTEAPEGINLMLIQAVCDKIWILDTGVVGLELTAPYAELLTVEARLALARDRSRRNKPTNRPRGVRALPLTSGTYVCFREI